QLGAQIAAARQRARSQAVDAGSEPADLSDVVIPLERVGPVAHAALQESIHLLAECYQNQPAEVRRDPLVLLTMTSDPELGTVIDTSQITDRNGKPLPRDLDACLRDRIDSLALPPLGTGGKLPLQYTFKFDDDAAADAGAPGR